jgi:AcrR family transcriptional regulator
MHELHVIGSQPTVGDTRARLLLAAMEVLETRGYRAASVATIAGRAGIATGTLYRCFASKADLFVALYRAIGDVELATMAAAAAVPHSAGAEVDAVVTTFAGRALSRPRLAWALVYEPLDPPVEAERLAYRRICAGRLAAFVRDGVERGKLPDQDPDTTAAALIGGIVEALVGPLAPFAEGNADPDAVIAALTAFCRRAIGADAEPAVRRALS